jgi:hypothetical protein
LINIDVDRDITLMLALDTLSTISALNEGAWNKLGNLGFLSEAPGRPWHVVQPVSIEGVEVPPLQVRVTRRPAVRRVDGYLGLAFFDAFAQVQLDVASRWLTLLPR